MITNLPIRTASASAVREPKQQRSPYAGWARFDPYVDNVGCTIRVVRRPSCLVAPPRACKIKGKDSPVKRQDYDEKDVQLEEPVRSSHSEQQRRQLHHDPNRYARSQPAQQEVRPPVRSAAHLPAHLSIRSGGYRYGGALDYTFESCESCAWGKVRVGHINCTYNCSEI